MMPAFAFDPTVFVQPGYEKADGDWSEADLKQIVQIRDAHPELREWGLLAVGSAWGNYSQDIMAVGWVDWIVDRNTDFLAYLYVSQLAPGFKWGGTGLFSDDVYKLGAQEPWHGLEHSVPAWASR